MNEYSSLLLVFLSASLGFENQGGGGGGGSGAPFGGIREHHTHPLDAQDFPFVPGTGTDGTKFVPEALESYQDITNETALYLPLVRKMAAKFVDGNSSDENFHVQYAGWKFSDTSKEVLFRFKVNETRNGNRTEVNCEMLMGFVKLNIYRLVRYSCIPAALAKCYDFKKGIRKIVFDIFRPHQRPDVSQINIVDCYGSVACISEYSIRAGNKTVTKLGCAGKIQTKNLSTSPDCRTNSESPVRDVLKVECYEALCNDPYKSEHSESNLFPVIERLNQAVQRLEDKISKLSCSN